MYYKNDKCYEFNKLLKGHGIMYFVFDATKHNKN